VQVCVSSAGAGTCGGGFWAMDWPNVTKVCRRCCTISSAFATAAAGGEFWGVEGCSGACPWLGERWGMIEGQVLGRGCVKVSGDGPMISSVPISPSVSDSSSSSSTSSSLGASPTC